ncbi:MAG: hypothetical protein RIQ99_1271 [Pseudomonadota bacterium]
MQTVTQLDPLRIAIDALRRDGPIALVPTMGALHEGHLTLVREARRRAAHVVVSIFVNPRQFGPREDLASYPRPIERDTELLQAEGVSLLWHPDAAAMYPAGYATSIGVEGVSAPLCGAARPGHFDGVATVVCDLVLPHADAIHAVPTVREADGLARSSRNTYLSAPERAQAAVLPQAMQTAVAAARAGTPYAAALETLCNTLLGGGFSAVDYAEIRDAASLELCHGPTPSPARLFVAARIGTTRLIDNLPV